MGCGASSTKKQGRTTATAPPFQLDDTQLVKVIGDKKQPAPSACLSRSAAARRRRLAMEELLARFDVSDTGALSAQEVKQLMISAWGEEFMPSNEDVELVMRVGGEKCNTEITVTEMPLAMAIVKSMAEEQMRLLATFAKYDVSNSGELSVDELANLLKELNDGVDASAEEVDLVLKQADCSGTGAISKEELKPAIMVWYGYVKESSKEITSKEESKVASKE